MSGFESGKVEVEVAPFRPTDNRRKHSRKSVKRFSREKGKALSLGNCVKTNGYIGSPFP
jgi:hypothetical protein